MVRLNPGSIEHFDTIDSDEYPGKKVFRFAFLMLDIFAKATINSKIRVRTLDGGHLYYDGMKYICLLIEMITGDGKRIPLAVALCDTEDSDNWKEFLDLVLSWRGTVDNSENVVSMAEVLNQVSEIFISDRDKGLWAAIDEKLSKSTKRKCFKHIERNFFEDASVTSSYNVIESQELYSATSAFPRREKSAKKKVQVVIY